MFPLKDDFKIGILVKRPAILSKSQISSLIFFCCAPCKHPIELGEEEGLFLNAKLQKSSACKASSSWSCTSLKRLLRYRLIFLWKQWHELPFKIAGWADFIQKSPSSVWSSTFLKFLSAEQWLEVLVLFVMFIGNLCFFSGQRWLFEVRALKVKIIWVSTYASS